MKKLLLICCLFFLSCHSHTGKNVQYDSIERGAQKQKLVQSELDSIPNYSYYLGLINHDMGGEATGFFVKRNGRLYLISNYHVFTGQNTVTKLKSNHFDSLSFVYQKLDGSAQATSISIKEISKNSKSHYFYEYPDIYCYDVTDKIPGNNVFSIEKYMIDIPSKKIVPTDIISIGFGISKKDVMHPVWYHFKIYNAIYDTLNIIYEKNRVVLKNSYLLTPQIETGMSGSPVFYIYSGKIVFGGILSSDFESNHTTLVVKPIELTKLLNAISIQPQF